MSQPSDLLDKAKWAAKAAQDRGARQVRATISRNTESTFEWRDGKVDRVRQSTQLSLQLAIYIDGKYSINVTSDLRPDAVHKLIDECIVMTKALSADPARALPDSARYADRSTVNIDTFDPAIQSVTADWRRNCAIELEKMIRSSNGADKLVSVSTTCSTNTSERAKVCSNGMEGMDASSSFYAGAYASVKDANGRKPGGGWSANTAHQADLPPLQTIADKALSRALLQIGAKPRKTGEYSCVVENVAANRLLEGLFEALEGRNLQQKVSFLASMIGKPIGSAALTIDDNPLVPRGLSSALFDGEGMSNRVTPLFAKGVLKNFYLDTFYARKLKMDPTTGTRSNLVYGQGKRSLDQLLAAMNTGVLITSFLGGNSNSATGDFSVGIQGQWIEGGKPVAPIAEMNLSGNHLKLWARLAEMGNDPYKYSSNQRPSMRFDKVQFSGV